jgi:hypothetical protein
LNSTANSKIVNYNGNKLSGGEKMNEKEKEDIEELREVLSVVSKEVPNLIKSIIATFFSEEAGKDMGKAAAAFYKELKTAGIPEETAVKMTENYVSIFTSLGDIMKSAVGGKKVVKMKEKGKDIGEEIEEEISKEIAKKLREKFAEKHGEEESEEED